MWKHFFFPILQASSYKSLLAFGIFLMLFKHEVFRVACPPDVWYFELQTCMFPSTAEKTKKTTFCLKRQECWGEGQVMVELSSVKSKIRDS